MVIGYRQIRKWDPTLMQRLELLELNTIASISHTQTHTHTLWYHVAMSGMKPLRSPSPRGRKVVHIRHTSCLHQRQRHRLYIHVVCLCVCANGMWWEMRSKGWSRSREDEWKQTQAAITWWERSRVRAGECKRANKRRSFLHRPSPRQQTHDAHFLLFPMTEAHK